MRAGSGQDRTHGVKRGVRLELRQSLAACVLWMGRKLGEAANRMFKVLDEKRRAETR